MENTVGQDQYFEVCFEMFSIFVLAKTPKDVSSFVSKTFGTLSVEGIFPSGDAPDMGQAVYRA